MFVNILTRHRVINATKFILNNLSNVATTKIENAVHLIESNDSSILEILKKTMIVTENFLTESEETSLLNEIEPYMKRLRYEYDHWDDVIHGYRETERLNWNENNQLILQRVKQFAFDYFNQQDRIEQPTNLLNHIHILDLHETGYIKPHVDAVRFCGNTIAGLCLLSDGIMRLISEKDKTKTALVCLKRRCLYIMR
jgi:alkylated DNA repair protein alkB family protein 7